MEEKELKNWALKCISLAAENAAGGGGPFAALIIRNGEVIAEGYNRVTATNDPTAHAEVSAIRAACQRLNDHQLSGCILITSCEPCPMCFGAIYWARPQAVYYVADKHDAAGAGFDDEFIYTELDKKDVDRSIPFYRIEMEEQLQPFEAWRKNADREEY